MIEEFAPTFPPEPVEIPSILPVLPLRDVVIYPYIIVPLSVSRDRSIKAVEFALASHRMLLLLAQRTEEIEDPEWDDLYRTGTVATIMRMLKLPDNRIRILVQGLSRSRLAYPTEESSFLQARVEPIPEAAAPESIESVAQVRAIKAGLEKSVALGKAIPSEVMVIAGNLREPGRLADLAASNLDVDVEEAQRVLETYEPTARLRHVTALLNRELEVLEMQQKITSEARSEIDKTQREFYLRQQLRVIEKELGEGAELGSEVQMFRDRLGKCRMPKAVREETEKQIERYSRMHPDGAETVMLRSYLECMTTLPWGKHSRDRIDLLRAAAVLDEDHHGLDKVKERILEFLAVRKLRRKTKGPILCLVGPPGVGKTSLGRSIARALGREFVRLSMGGVRDEAEIRGHRRTYVGAMPGRIIQGLLQAGTANPVFMIDEVDKIGADFRGDPSSALLEVLDPQQNGTFRDHYLNVPFDLSKVMFIATGNLIDPVQPALRDRMEVVRIEGYTDEEKLRIVSRYLLPRQLEEHGLKPGQLTISDPVVLEMIRGYTREAGLRNLDREVAAVCRKVAREVAEDRRKSTRLTSARLRRFLGPPRSIPDEMMTTDRVGVAMGLAWTEAGGEVLFVEASAMPGKGTLLLTGQLGAVMQESAQAALSYLRVHAQELGLEPQRFATTDVHVHLPEGAIPKDGPSAGVTMAVAMCSALSLRPVRRSLAMTGEITLRGDVLAVGGIKEKVLAARRLEVLEVILPMPNRRHMVEVPPAVARDLTVHYVGSVREVLDLALGPVPALATAGNGAPRPVAVPTPTGSTRPRSPRS